MSKKAAGKAKAVRKAKAVTKTSTDLPPIEAERLLDIVASMRELIPAEWRREAQPPEGPADLRFSFLPAEEKTIRLFEWMAVADAVGSLTEELTEWMEKANEKVVADILNVYYWAEETVNDPNEVLSDAQREQLTSYVELVRATYRRDFGTEIPPKK